MYRGVTKDPLFPIQYVDGYRLGQCHLGHVPWTASVTGHLNGLDSIYSVDTLIPEEHFDKLLPQSEVVCRGLHVAVTQFIRSAVVVIRRFSSVLESPEVN